MGFAKDDRGKDFMCRQCGLFLDQKELKDGNCPDCGTDEDLFMNDENED